MINAFKSHCQLLTAALMTSACLLYSGQVLADQAVVGWLEKVRIFDSDIQFEAKIDTGADNTSIHAKEPEFYTRDGRPWIRFNLLNKQGQELAFDKPIIKKTRVKMKDGRLQERPVIQLDVCLAGIKKQVKANLVDRSHFKYRVLIGRNFLKPEFLVNSATTYSATPECS